MAKFSVPAIKLSEFAHNLGKILFKKHYRKSDFKDIDAVEPSLGMNVLHVAVELGLENDVKKLLSFNASTSQKTFEGRTPLKLSQVKGHHDITKVIIEHKMPAPYTAQFISDYKPYKTKGQGVTSGGFFTDNNQVNWLLKEGHANTPKAVIKEYVAGGLYQHLLGDNAPETEIVINAYDLSLMTGSKILDNFEVLHSIFGWHDFEDTYNDKPIVKLLDVVCAAKLLSDNDAHAQNVGLIEHADHYEVAKIDHGLAFYFRDETITLNKIKKEIYSRYDIEHLSDFGYDAVYTAIDNIVSKPLASYFDIISDKMKDAINISNSLELTNISSDYYFQDLYNNLEKSALDYQQRIMSGVQKNYNDFKVIADYMQLEQFIISHDSYHLQKSLLERHLDLSYKFDSFYDKDTDMPNQRFLSVTGDKLLEKHWPSLHEALHNEVNPLSYHDIIDFSLSETTMSTPDWLSTSLSSITMDLLPAPIINEWFL